MEKGDAIRFVKGTYRGHVGWTNKAKRATSRGMIAVIVLLDKKTKKVKATKVKRTSIRKPLTEPTSKEQAAVQQHSDLELAMIKHAELWAEMGTIDTAKVVKLFEDELFAAQKRQRRAGKCRFVTCPALKRKADDDADDDADVSVDSHY